MLPLPSTRTKCCAIIVALDATSGLVERTYAYHCARLRDSM